MNNKQFTDKGNRNNTDRKAGKKKNRNNNKNNRNNKYNKKNIRRKRRKDNLAAQWWKLTIANNFMFKKVFGNKELCLELLRLILPELHIEDISFPEKEREMKETADGKGVRLDVYTTDDRKRVYDLEMQVRNTMELPRRSRYYAGMIDQTELG